MVTLVTFAVAGLALVAAAGALILATASMARGSSLRATIERLAATGGEFRSDAADPRAVRGVGVVRYDAFKDMAGQMSFSLALLDSVGDGVVLTTINARTEARTYIKMVRAGEGVQALSPEEEQAVNQALDGSFATELDKSWVSAR